MQMHHLMEKELTHILLPHSFSCIFAIASLQLVLNDLCIFLEIRKAEEDVTQGNVVVIPKPAAVGPGVGNDGLVIN
jgi:hypothetical protein